LHAVVSQIKISHPADLRQLLPAFCFDRFTTLELAEALGRPVWFAQKVAYCLRESGAARAVGKRGNRLVYAFESGADARSAGFADSRL
jgi:hypothetical protein